jgi:hypothetical protein
MDLKFPSTEAKMMAAIARGYVSVQRFVNKEWEALSESDISYYENAKSQGQQPLYRAKMHEDHLLWLEKFADFCVRSKGFSIH